MQIDDIDIERRQILHCLLHRIGDIVQLEIEEDAVSQRPHLFDDVKSKRVGQLHADLDRDRFIELFEKVQHFFSRGEIKRRNGLLVHPLKLLPTASLTELIPYFLHHFLAVAQ